MPKRRGVERGTLPIHLGGLESIVSSPSGVRSEALEAIEFLRYNREKMAFPSSLILHLIQLKHITQTCSLINTVYFRLVLNFLKLDISLKTR